MKHGSVPTDIRGASRLAVDITMRVTTLVETMHRNIARRAPLLGRVADEPARGVTGLVYGSVRGITQLVGAGIDAALAQLSPLLDRVPDWEQRDTLVAALNGVLGDHLDDTRNPLAIPMRLRIDGAPREISSAPIAASLAHPSGCIVVMVHGLCMSDRHWHRKSHDHGRALAQRLNANTVYLQYNSGRHVARNGAQLSGLLDQLLDEWPVPVERLMLVGHSMGGLVIRSACAAARRDARAWIERLAALVFIGTPHHGAPLERAGHVVELALGASPYTAAFAQLARLRSAGITDLRHGSVGEPLPRGVACFAIAGSRSPSAPKRGGVARGDGLVTVASALGRHADARRALDFPASHRFIAYDTGHLDLLSSAAVCARMERWLGRLPAAPFSRSAAASA